MPLILNGDGSVGPLSATEVGYLDGVTSAVQTQINTKYQTPSTSSWISFTPSWSGLNLGNGSTSGLYLRLGNTIMFMAKFVFGSTSSVTGAVGFSTPTTMSGLTLATFMNAKALDSGTTYYNLFCWYGGIFAASSTSGAAQNLSSTFPFTWAVNDEIHVSGTYIEA